MIKLILLSFTLMIFGNHAVIAAGNSGRYLMTLGAKGGMGTSGAENEAVVKNRDHFLLGADVNLGLRFGKIILGGAADYVIWNQSTKISEVNNTNMSANQFNLMPMMGIQLGQLVLLGKWVLSSEAKLSKLNSSNQKIIYLNPATDSYQLQGIYQYSISRYFGLEYSSVRYCDTKRNGVESALSSQITYSGWSLLYGFIF